MTRFFALGLLLVITQASARNEGNPVQKVIGLLERMQEKIQTEGKAEAAAYDKFACFCKEQADEKMYRITKGKEKIAMLTASIELLEADITKLNEEAEQAGTDIENLTKEMEDNDSQRESDFEAFASDRNDLQDALDRLDEAIQDMSGSKDKMSGAGVKKDFLLSTKVSEQDKTAIAELDAAMKSNNATDAKKAAMLAAGAKLDTTDVAEEPTTEAESRDNWQQAKNWRKTRRALQLLADGPVKLNKEQHISLVQWAASGRQPAFEFSSNKHIDIVKDLVKAYKQKKYERETQEAGSKHAYMMARQANQHNLDALNDLKTKLETTSAAKSEEKGANEKEKEETQADVDADQSFLDEVTEDCEKKAEAWDARSKVRTSELAAIAECLGIMNKGVVGKYGANKKLVGLVTEHSQVSSTTNVQASDEDEDSVDVEDEAEDSVNFLQRRKRKNVRISGKQKVALKKQVMDFLSKKGLTLKDAVLTSVAFKVHENDFGEVKKLIGDLIQKLKDEAKAAEEQSSWCKDEMTAASDRREEGSANIDKEESAITLNKAQIETLKGEVKELTNEISALYKALNEQTQLREEDHVDNEQTLADTRAGNAALTAAKDVLENFYNDPTAFAQVASKKHLSHQKGPDADGNSLEDLAPESDSFTGDNQGKQEEAGGIIGLLTVIGTDFERTIESTEQAEKDNEADFQTFKSDTEADIDEKKSSKDEKEGEINTTEADNEQNAEDLADAKTMKAEAIDTMDKLKPVCLNSGASFQERKERREQEIAALEEAMKIIDELK